jgi:hypothetical protein
MLAHAVRKLAQSFVETMLKIGKARIVRGCLTELWLCADVRSTTVAASTGWTRAVAIIDG